MKKCYPWLHNFKVKEVVHYESYLDKTVGILRNFEIPLTSMSSLSNRYDLVTYKCSNCEYEKVKKLN